MDKDYEKMYHELCGKVKKLLLDNEKKRYSPSMLLVKLDILRFEIEGPEDKN